MLCGHTFTYASVFNHTIPHLCVISPCLLLFKWCSHLPAWISRGLCFCLLMYAIDDLTKTNVGYTACIYIDRVSFIGLKWTRLK
jgi:hypothetical protein